MKREAVEVQRWVSGLRGAHLKKLESPFYSLNIKLLSKGNMAQVLIIIAVLVILIF